MFYPPLTLNSRTLCLCRGTTCFRSKWYNYYPIWRKEWNSELRDLFGDKNCFILFTLFANWYGFWNDESLFQNIQFCLQSEKLTDYLKAFFLSGIHLSSGQYNSSRLLKTWLVNVNSKCSRTGRMQSSRYRNALL